MVDIDGHSSDTGGEPSIYPDPEHAAHSSWLTALPGLNDFTTNNATEGVKQFTRRFGCAPNDLPGRSDDVFSPENAFIDIAEYSPLQLQPLRTSESDKHSGLIGSLEATPMLLLLPKDLATLQAE